MNLILGGSGHVGSAVANALLDHREPVTVIVHDAAKAAALQQRGAAVAVADVADSENLRAIFRRGKRLFLLNPPAKPSTDTDVEERKTIRGILAAVQGSGLERIVAQSTYGAQPGAHLGDLGSLYEMEQQLAAQAIPTAILRAAYYMTNWDAALRAAQAEGVVHTFYPHAFELPMLAPADVGPIAARLMTEPRRPPALTFVEGPERYTSADVADAFSTALKRPVRAQQTPRSAWESALAAMGFSQSAAASFAAMTDATLTGEFPDRSKALRGPTTLQAYISKLVRASAKPA